MKKTIAATAFLLFGMTAMVFAQNDNASALTTRGAQEAGLIYSNPYGVFTGPVTLVETPSGHLNLSWTGKQEADGPEDLKTPFREEYLGIVLFGRSWDIHCIVTPGDVAVCNGKETAL